jgi:3-hydroxybutyryl-CoA dehydrogenase
LIATNSSSIKISHIEDVTKHPERVFNMHFYSYPWRRSVLELMKGTRTTDETIETAKVFSQSIGVYPLIVLKESTGFIFNRIWRAIKKESLRVVDTCVASFEDVDRAWMSLYRTEMGPFGMMDRVGLDVVYDIEMVYYEESGDNKDKPQQILQDKIKKGELGAKTGKGFYTYPDPSYMKPGWLHGEE